MPVIKSLQVFRGLAAFAVVSHHAVVSTDAFVGIVPYSINSILVKGYLGVDFFFVLSGFIIMYTHMNDNQTNSSLLRYILKRVTRIYPPYLPISITLIAFYKLMPELSASGGREYSLMSSFLLIPSDLPPALPVAWTLIHEMIFYTFFLLFFISPRVLFFGLMAWGG